MCICTYYLGTGTGKSTGVLILGTGLECKNWVVGLLKVHSVLFWSRMVVGTQYRFRTIFRYYKSISVHFLHIFFFIHIVCTLLYYFWVSPSIRLKIKKIVLKQNTPMYITSARTRSTFLTALTQYCVIDIIYHRKFCKSMKKSLWILVFFLFFNFFLLQLMKKLLDFFILGPF